MASTVCNTVVAGGTTIMGVLTEGYNGVTVGGAAPHALTGPISGTFDADIVPLTPAAVAMASHHYFGDYYNRIWLIPVAIDFNSVSAETQQSFYVWNSYTGQRTLSSVGQLETEGLILGGPILPRVFKALELVQLDITATLDGPPSIKAKYTFNFADAEDVSLPVVGTRSKLWPFAVNWSEPFNVNLEYKTEIITSRSGKEQRRALRTSPRKSLEFSSVIDGDKFRAFKRLVSSWQNRSLVMPEFTRQTKTAAMMAAGANTVTVESAPSWLVSGVTVVLVYEEALALREVDSVVGSTITFTSVGGEVWPAGTKIHPGLSGLLDAELAVGTPVNSAATVRVRFDVTPASEPAPQPGAAAATFDGRELLLKRPNWANAIDISYNYDRESVDYGRGRTSVFRPIAFGTQIRRGTYVGNPAAEVESLVDFFNRMKGQRGEFYAATGEPDLMLKQTVAAGNFDLRIAGRDVLQAYEDDTVHRAIAVRMMDGSRFQAKVDLIFAVEDAGGLDTIIRLHTATPYTLDPNEVAAVSWLYLCRHATDRLTVEWITDNVAQMAMSFQTLENMTAETI